MLSDIIYRYYDLMVLSRIIIGFIFSFIYIRFCLFILELISRFICDFCMKMEVKFGLFNLKYAIKAYRAKKNIITFIRKH